MMTRPKTGSPSRGFIMLMIAVLIIIVLLLLIASRYRQFRHTPNMERKGVALLLPAS
jgi:LPXTG-motif cell wall-anchored protein